MIFTISFILLFLLLCINKFCCKDKMCNIIINIHSVWWVLLISYIEIKSVFFK